MKKLQFGELKRVDTITLLPTEVPLQQPKQTMGQNSPDIANYAPLNKYDEGLVYGTNQAKLRAQNQGLWDEVKIGTLNTLNNIIPSTIEGLAMVPSLFQNSRDARITNETVQKAIEPYKNVFSQQLIGDNQIYTEDDMRAYALSNIFGIVESGISFIGTGGVIGGVLGKAAKAKQIASVLNGLSKSQNLRAGVNVVNNLKQAGNTFRNSANTFLTSSVEGQLNGLEASNQMKQKYQNDLAFREKVQRLAQQKGISEFEAFNQMLDTAYATTANISTMVGVPLNYSGLSALFTPSSALKAYKKSAGSLFTGEFIETAIESGGIRRLKDWGKEIVQEGIEEGLQSVAGKIGTERAEKGQDKIALGNYIKLFDSVENSGKNLIDSEFWESAMWGALGGGIQSGAINGVNYLANGRKEYNNNKQAYEFLKQDFLKSVDKVGNLKKELDSILENVNNDQDLNIHKQRINDIKSEIFDVTLRESLKRGNTDLLINDLKDILELDTNKTERDLISAELQNLTNEYEEQGINIQELYQRSVDPTQEQPLNFEEQETVKPFLDKVDEYNNASNLTIPELYNFEEGFKDVAQQKIIELESLTKEFNDFSSLYPDNTERQRVNTIDLFTMKRDIAKINQELVEANEKIETAKLGIKDIDSLTAEDFEEGVDTDTEISRLKDQVVDQTLIEERDKIKEKKEQLEKEYNLKSSKKYYEQLNDYTTQPEELEKVSQDLKEVIKKDQILDGIKKRMFNQLSEKNRFYDNKKALLDRALSDTSTIIDIQNSLSFITTEEELNQISDVINERIIALKDGFLQSIEEFKSSDTTYRVEGITGDDITYTLNDIDEGLEDVESDMHDNFLDSLEVAEQIKKLRELNPKINKEFKLKSEFQLAKEFVEDTIESININIEAIDDDLASLYKEKERLKTLQYFLQNQKEYNLEYDLESLSSLIAKKELDIQKKLDLSEKIEQEKWAKYKNSIGKSTKESKQKFIDSLPIKFRTTFDGLSSIANFLRARGNADLTFDIISDFNITDDYIKTLSSNIQENVIPQLKEYIEEIKYSEGAQYVDDTDFTQYFTEETPFPEQIIAIYQGVHALLKSDRNVYLQGLAGTGKTDIVLKYIFKILQEQQHGVHVLGVGELVHAKLNKNLLDREVNDNPAQTLDTWKAYIDDIKLSSNKKTFLFIDEAPKLTQEQVDYVVNKPGIQIFFTGDPLQLSGATTDLRNTVLKHNPIFLTPLTQSKRSAHPSILKYQYQFSKNKLEDDFSYEVENNIPIEGVKKISSVKLASEELSENTAIITDDITKYSGLKHKVYTVGETQGSEWDNVILDIEDLSNKEKYVAASRAKKLILTIDKNIKNNPSSKYEVKENDTSRFDKNIQWFNKEFGINEQSTENVSDEDFNEFVDTGNVSEEKLNEIIEKIKNGEILDEKEQAIANDKVSEINERLVQEQEGDEYIDSEDQINISEKETVEQEVQQEETYKRISPSTLGIKSSELKIGDTVTGIPVLHKDGQIVMKYYAESKDPQDFGKWIEVGMEYLKEANFKKVKTGQSKKIEKEVLDKYSQDLDKSEYVVTALSPMNAEFLDKPIPMTSNPVKQVLSDFAKSPIVSQRVHISNPKQYKSTDLWTPSKVNMNTGATFIRYKTESGRSFDIEVHGNTMSQKDESINLIFNQIKLLEKIDNYLPENYRWGVNDFIEEKRGDIHYTKNNLFDAFADYFVNQERSELYEMKQQEMNQLWASLSDEIKEDIKTFTNNLYTYGVVGDFNNDGKYGSKKEIVPQSNQGKDGLFYKVSNRKRKIINYEFGGRKKRTIQAEINLNSLSDYTITFSRMGENESIIWEGGNFPVKSEKEIVDIVEEIATNGTANGKVVKKTRKFGVVQRAFHDIAMANIEYGDETQKIYFRRLEEKVGSDGNIQYEISNTPISLYNYSTKRVKSENGELKLAGAREVLKAFQAATLEGKIFTPLDSDFLKAINKNMIPIEELYKISQTKFKNFNNSVLEIANQKIIKETPVQTEEEFNPSIQEILEGDLTDLQKRSALNLMKGSVYRRKNRVQNWNEFKAQVEKALESLPKSSIKEEDSDITDQANNRQDEC